MVTPVTKIHELVDNKKLTAYNDYKDKVVEGINDTIKAHVSKYPSSTSMQFRYSTIVDTIDYEIEYETLVAIITHVFQPAGYSITFNYDMSNLRSIKFDWKKGNKATIKKSVTGRFVLIFCR